MNKKDLKDILLTLKEDDYFSKADLHIHSNKSDGKMNPLDIINYAKNLNKKYISITDHNNIEAYLTTNILAEDIVITGVEFDCIYKGVVIHILGYNIDIDNKEIKAFFANSKAGSKNLLTRILNLRNPAEVILKIKQSGGISVLAHPARYPVYNLDKFVKILVDFGLEGIETYYPYKGLKGIFKFHSVNEIKEIAQKYHLLKTGGTDTHGKILK